MKIQLIGITFVLLLIGINKESKNMNADFILNQFLTFNIHEIINSESIILSKFTLYLVLSKPLRIQKRIIKKFKLATLIHFIKMRGKKMKTLQIFSTILYTLLFLTIINGCYTTFYSVKRASAIEDEYYLDEYDYYNDEYIEETTLEFRPSRFIVETRYFDYGNYVRKVRYIAYDYDPWYDPYPITYYEGSGISINIHLGFGFSYFYHPWHPVHFYPDVYFAWGPTYPWYDPWFCYPIYYPVYYPTPVYYPYPVPYHHPYYSGPYHARNYKKRDWDRRQQQAGSRIADRRINPGNDSKGSPIINNQLKAKKRSDITTNTDNKRIALRDRGKIERPPSQVIIDRKNDKEPISRKTDTNKTKSTRTINRNSSTPVLKDRDQNRQETHQDISKKYNMTETRTEKSNPRYIPGFSSNKNNNLDRVIEDRTSQQRVPSYQRNTISRETTSRVQKENQKQTKTYESNKSNRSQSSNSISTSNKSNKSSTTSSKSYQSRPSSSQQKSKSSSSTKKADNNKNKKSSSRRR